MANNILTTTPIIGGNLTAPVAPNSVLTTSSQDSSSSSAVPFASLMSGLTPIPVTPAREISATLSPVTDIRVEGRGAFILGNSSRLGDSPQLARSGQFGVDANGFLINNAGQKVEAWPLNQSGYLPTLPQSSQARWALLQPVQIPRLDEAVATTEANFRFNLDADGTAIPPSGYNPTTGLTMASGTVSAEFSNGVNVYDANGAGHNLSVGLIKTGDNTWTAEVYIQQPQDVAPAGSSGYITSGTVTFDANGNLSSISPSLRQPLTVQWADGAPDSHITLDLGKPGTTTAITQFHQSYLNKVISSNGNAAEHLTGVSIDPNGQVVATYQSGRTYRGFQIPLAEPQNNGHGHHALRLVPAQTSGAGQFS
jgi:flagellar hook protein FlgE